MFAIECNELVKTYGEATVVDHVSFAIDRGEVFGFLGPNGAGKTTTMRMVLGLTRPTAGRAALLGSPCPPPAQVVFVNRKVDHRDHRKVDHPDWSFPWSGKTARALAEPVGLALKDEHVTVMGEAIE
jgi:ABC-type multidrug transport system ATPase subunit